MNTAERATLAGRRAAERLMVNTATVERMGTTRDPLTGDYERVTVHSGKCRIRTYQPHEANPEVGGATVTVQRYEAHFPVGAFVPRVNDVITITAARLDPTLVGREYRVVALHHEGLATAMRLGVEEVV